MNVVYIDITSIMNAFYTALRTVINWLTNHGITLNGVSVSFFGLSCAVLVASILLSFIVYDDDDNSTNTED